MNNDNVPAVSESGIMKMSVAVDTIYSLRELGSDFAKSGILGEITQSQGTVSLLAMRDEKLSVTAFRRKYQWVGNELSTRPNWMLGEFKRLGGKAHIVQADEDACEIEFTHWDGETLTMRITKDQMVANGVAVKSDGKTLKDNWRKFSDDMLFARVCGKALRRLAPEVFAGAYTDGEAADFDAPPPPREIPAEKVRSRIRKVAAAEEHAPDKEAEDAQPDEQAQDESAPVEPEVMPSSDDFDDEDGRMTCPIKGEWFGKTFSEIAASNPDIIVALLKCNRAKHPELTNRHLSALERIAVKIG